MLRLRSILNSSRAAIDLASIMVGVIIIGLIGGVIAATVFAVIPWSQDKAAKQQLESIHAAENAFYGLSSDPSQNLVGGKKNSFADSDDLATNNLLAKSEANVYCVTAATDGKNYDAYVKAASGKVFTAKNSNKTPTQVVGTPTAPVQTCLGPITGGVVETPTTPETPVTPANPNLVSFFDYEETTLPGTIVARTSSATPVLSTEQSHAGVQSVKTVRANTSSTVFGVRQPTSATPGTTTYRISAWVYAETASISSAQIRWNNGAFGKQIPAKTWTFISVDTPIASNWVEVTFGTDSSSAGQVGYVDEVSVTKL